MGFPDQSGWRAAGRLGLLAWRCVTVAKEMVAATGTSAVVGRGGHARRVHQLARQLCRDHAVQVLVQGRVPDCPAILVANHVSHLDPLVIASVTPLLPIAKAEIDKWPLIGRVGRYLGIMFVRRDSVVSGARVLRQALRALQQGVSVLNFPEGTTTFGSDVLPFKRGIFGLAAMAGVPVIPIALRFEPKGMAWVGDAHFVPHCLRTFAQARWTAYASFGKAFYGAEESSAEELAELSRREITRLLASGPGSHKTAPPSASPPVLASSGGKELDDQPPRSVAYERRCSPSG